jgi:hypothetical protein
MQLHVFLVKFGGFFCHHGRHNGVPTTNWMHSCWTRMDRVNKLIDAEVAICSMRFVSLTIGKA